MVLLFGHFIKHITQSSKYFLGNGYSISYLKDDCDIYYAFRNGLMLIQQVSKYWYIKMPM